MATITTGSFQRVQFYCAIGITTIGNRCCIYVDTIHPNEILHPHNDSKHIVHTLFKFYSAKKAPFGTIITNLRGCGIYPEGLQSQFIPMVNPDNKFYTRLRGSDLGIILDVIRQTVNGLYLINTNNRIHSGVEEILTSDEELIIAREREKPRLLCDSLSLIILEPKATRIHQYSRIKND